MDTVTLPPELEQFAEEAVASPICPPSWRPGWVWLQRKEQARAAFNASLAAAEAEGEQEGFVTIEEVHQEINELIDDLDRART